MKRRLSPGLRKIVLGLAAIILLSAIAVYLRPVDAYMAWDRALLWLGGFEDRYLEIQHHRIHYYEGGTDADQMSTWEDDVNRHTAELVRLTLKAADQGPDPLPEEEVANLGMVIATERQLLIDAMSGLRTEDEPEAAASPGVAEFDAGFLYGLAFARALDDARIALDRVRRGQVLKLVKGNGHR